MYKEYIFYVIITTFV